MNIIESESACWDALVATSAQGTVFHRSNFMEAGGRGITYLLCKKGDTVLAGMAFCVDGRSAFPMGYQHYNGIVFAGTLADQSFGSNERRYKISMLFAEYLFDAFDSLRFDNHWSVQDTRPFAWHNYHTPEKGQYVVSVRHTSILDLTPGIENGEGFASVRRRIYKKSFTQEQSTELSSDVDCLLELYEKTFSRQAIALDGGDILAVDRICRQSITDGSGQIYLTRVNGKPGTASLFLMDRHGAYYMFGATDPELRSSETGTKNMVDSMVRLRDDHSCARVDFVGINSPGRGWYKLSFGGSVTPYFAVTR